MPYIININRDEMTTGEKYASEGEALAVAIDMAKAYADNEFKGSPINKVSLSIERVPKFEYISALWRVVGRTHDGRKRTR